MRWTTTGLFFAVLLLLSTIRAAPLQPLADEDDDPSRLPKTSQPIRYDIALTTNVHTGDRAFSGVVKIDIIITADTDTITLHNNGLTPINIRLYDNGINGDIPHNTSADASRSFFFITSTDRILQVDELYTIEITYSGQLQTSMNGFYISSYRRGSETR